MKQPQLISFTVKGNSEEGHLHIAENTDLPFPIQRLFYTMDTPLGITRGRHAHHQTEMILIAIQGSIEVQTITIDGNKHLYTLNHPNEGLYLPVLCWHEMNYSENAIQLVLCNSLYNAEDYIRDWQQFTTLQQHHGTR